MARHWQLEHTADVGVAAEAESFELLLAELARGMFEFIVDPKKVLPVEEYEGGEVGGESLEGLVVNWLNELLYLHEVHEILFCRFSPRRVSPLHVVGKAMGESIDPERHAPIGAVKAATYHALSAEQKEGLWHARVYFDV